MKYSFALIASITILILTVIFTLQNTQVAHVKFLVWNTETSLSLILFITFSIGIIASVIALLPVIIKHREIRKNE